MVELMIVLPLAIAWFGAAILALLDGRQRWVGWLGVAVLGAVLAADIWLLNMVLQRGELTMVTGGYPIGIGITLRGDPLGMSFATLSTAVLLVSLAYEVLGQVRERALPALVLFMGAGLNGLFLTGDAFNFYVFFELAVTSSFILASYGMRGRELRATLIFAVINLLGSVFFLSSVLALYHVTGSLDIRTIALSVAEIDPRSSILIATLIFVAFSLKLGLFPFHFWLPPIYRDSHPAVAAMLSGALANIGSYGLLRFGAGLFSDELRFGVLAVLLLGGVSIIYGALQAITVRSASEALAYSAIGQAGYILIAIAIGGPLGYSTAVLYALLNSLNKTLLFLATGLRGWLVGAAFAIGAFSTAGVPPTAGFFGKLALFQASVAEGSLYLVALIFAGSALSFVYMFQIYQHDHWTQPPDSASPRPVRVLVFAIAAVVIGFGVWPEPLLAVSRQAADVVLRRGL